MTEKSINPDNNNSNNCILKGDFSFKILNQFKMDELSFPEEERGLREPVKYLSLFGPAPSFPVEISNILRY